MSFSLILPFLRPIENLILSEDVSEVMVNPSGRVFVERDGLLNEVLGVCLEPKQLEVAVRNIARRLGDDISEEKPILDSRLPDGSRVCAIYAPCSVGGTTLVIRKFSSRWFTVSELAASGTLTRESACLLQAFIHERRNVLISGGTGTGKTTLLNALALFIPETERVILIEDTAEIRLEKPNLVCLEARGARPSLPAVTVRDLVKASLRLRPDRIIVGEIRGGEAFDLLQALNTGHAGSLSTIHADSASLAISRLTNCVLQSGVDVPITAIQRGIADSINVVVQMERVAGKRIVSEIIRVHGMAVESGELKLESVFKLVR